MRSLRFRELLLQSPWDRTARRITFHPDVTIVRGRNGAGKTALLTSMYRCFGAEPTQPDGNWRHLQAYSAIRFDLRGQTYRLLHADPVYALFNSDDRVLRVFPGAVGLGEFLSDWLGTQAISKESKLARAITPAALLAPFYLDQDVGWQRPWAGFRELGYFARAHADLAEFLIGTKSATHFECLDRLADAKRRREHARHIDVGLASVAKGVQEAQYAPLSFNIDEQAYKAEIQALVAKCDALRVRQEEFREQFVGASNRKKELEIQIAIVEAAAKEAQKDYEYALDVSDEGTLKCPTCGAEYQHSFRERFGLKNDESDCRAVSMKLRRELKALNDRVNELAQNYRRNEAEFAEVNRHLDRRLGVVELRDLLSRKGQELLREVVDAQRTKVSTEIVEIEREISRFRAQVDDDERSPQRRLAFQVYASTMKKHLGTLGVRGDFARQEAYGGLGLNLSKSVRARGVRGSALPRTLLAYHFTILELINQFSPRVICPLVVDSPRQQDPDAETLRSVLEFVRDRRLSGQQLILAAVDTVGVSFSGTVVDLPDARGLLRSSEYASVASEMRALLEQLPIDRLLW